VHSVLLDRASLAAVSFMVLASGASGASADPNIPWTVFTFIFTSVIGLYTWLSRRHAATSSDLSDVEKSVAVISERILHLPTQPQVAALDASVRELSAEIHGLNKRLEAAGQRLNRVEDYLERKFP